MKGKLFSNHGHNFFFVICALVFTFLISVGYTGSSVSCFDSPFFAPLARTIYGKGQAVRSDEYAVNLMSYISQLNNSENSNYNKNYGVEGKKWELSTTLDHLPSNSMILANLLPGAFTYLSPSRVK